MENKEPALEEVRDFVEGKMESDKKAAFEKMLASDQGFAREFHLKKIMLSGMDMYFSKNLKKKLQEEEKNNPGKEKKERKRNFKIYRISAIAACILLILFSTFQVWFSVPNHEKVFAEFFQPYPNVVDGAERQLLEKKQSPFQLYENRDYEKAIAAFNIELKSKPKDIELNFYLALCYLSLEEAEQAIPYLERNLTNPKPEELMEANQWFLGLAYVKAGNLEKALSLLTEISRSESSYKESAQSVIERLK